jgi:hypothetical protein
MSDEQIEARMDRDSLYREEMISDRKMGTLRVMIPIKPDGSEDETRKVLYVGQAQIMTPMGALPVAFEIEADSLDKAVDGYADAAKEAIENTIKELKELQRQAQSSIVVPGSGGGAGGMGGLGGGGMPGGGGIQMP